MQHAEISRCPHLEVSVTICIYDFFCHIFEGFSPKLLQLPTSWGSWIRLCDFPMNDLRLMVSNLVLEPSNRNARVRVCVTHADMGEWLLTTLISVKRVIPDAGGHDEHAEVMSNNTWLCPARPSDIISCYKLFSRRVSLPKLWCDLYLYKVGSIAVMHRIGVTLRFHRMWALIWESWWTLKPREFIMVLQKYNPDCYANVLSGLTEDVLTVLRKIYPESG